MDGAGVKRLDNHDSWVFRLCVVWVWVVLCGVTGLLRHSEWYKNTVNYVFTFTRHQKSSSSSSQDTCVFLESMQPSWVSTVRFVGWGLVSLMYVTAQSMGCQSELNTFRAHTDTVNAARWIDLLWKCRRYPRPRKWTDSRGSLWGRLRDSGRRARLSSRWTVAGPRLPRSRRSRSSKVRG